MLVFDERGNRSTWRKPLGAEWTPNKLNSHMTSDLGIEPEPHWWEASTLTNAPSLHTRAMPASQFRNILLGWPKRKAELFCFTDQN